MASVLAAGASSGAERLSIRQKLRKHWWRGPHTHIGGAEGGGTLSQNGYGFLPVHLERSVVSWQQCSCKWKVSGRRAGARVPAQRHNHHHSQATARPTTRPNQGDRTRNEARCQGMVGAAFPPRAERLQAHQEKYQLPKGANGSQLSKRSSQSSRSLGMYRWWCPSGSRPKGSHQCGGGLQMPKQKHRQRRSQPNHWEATAQAAR